MHLIESQNSIFNLSLLLTFLYLPFVEGTGDRPPNNAGNLPQPTMGSPMQGLENTMVLEMSQSGRAGGFPGLLTMVQRDLQTSFNDAGGAYGAGATATILSLSHHYNISEGFLRSRLLSV